MPLLLFFCSLYTFDMRFLDKPLMVHMDHVSAVLDVDYSPTGKEFVSASFDKSIRIFPVDKGHSRSVILQISFSWDPSSSTSSLNILMNSFSVYDTRFPFTVFWEIVAFFYIEGYWNSTLAKQIEFYSMQARLLCFLNPLLFSWLVISLVVLLIQKQLFWLKSKEQL